MYGLVDFDRFVFLSAGGGGGAGKKSSRRTEADGSDQCSVRRRLERQRKNFTGSFTVRAAQRDRADSRRDYRRPQKRFAESGKIFRRRRPLSAGSAGNAE